MYLNLYLHGEFLVRVQQRSSELKYMYTAWHMWCRCVYVAVVSINVYFTIRYSTNHIDPKPTTASSRRIIILSIIIPLSYTPFAKHTVPATTTTTVRWEKNTRFPFFFLAVISSSTMYSESGQYDIRANKCVFILYEKVDISFSLFSRLLAYIYLDLRTYIYRIRGRDAYDMSFFSLFSIWAAFAKFSR